MRGIHTELPDRAGFIYVTYMIKVSLDMDHGTTMFFFHAFIQ